MSKKIWLSVHPRNIGSDKIVGAYVHPFMLADVKWHTLILASPRHTVCVFGIGHTTHGGERR